MDNRHSKITEYTELIEKSDKIGSCKTGDDELPQGRKPFEATKQAEQITHEKAEKYTEKNTESLIAELEIAAKEWQLTFDATSETIVLLSPDFKILKINRAGCQAFGKTSEELRGKKCYELAHGTDAPIKECPCSKTLITKKAGEGELSYMGRYLSLKAFPVLDKSGELTAFVHTVTDITEEKQNEQKLIEDQKRLALMNEKLRVVGSITRHDVRNKLSTVKGVAYLLKKKCADHPSLIADFSIFENSVKEIEKIFSFTEIYEKLGVEKLTYIEVDKTIREAVALFSGLTLKIVNDSQGLTVLADSFLRQIFYNLIDDTIKHAERATQARLYYNEAKLGDALQLIYEDDGVGISAENKPLLFREGFSTGGTGYGLFLIKKMIEVYDWTIQETGEPGKGARFIITIPKTDKNGTLKYKIQKNSE